MSLSARVSLVALAFAASSTAYTWPNPQFSAFDDLIYAQQGYLSSPVSSLITPCDSFSFGSTVNRSNAADWIRAAYHDVATHNVKDGTGGMDGSIQYEMGRPENAGTTFFDTLLFLTLEIDRYVSVADIMSIALKLAVEQCSGPKVDFRGGRIDATAANSPGVPQPFESLESHTASFARQGFNQTEMITLVACGHSFGGVQHSAFPDIVEPQQGVSDVQATFDSTPFTFDNAVAAEFIDGTTTNPLAAGFNDTTNSDKRIFSSDGNVTMTTFAQSPEAFKTACGALFTRMIDTVPAGVNLSEIIEPLPAKPAGVMLTYMGDGTLKLSGNVRFWNMSEKDSRKATLLWADRSGNTNASYSATMGRSSEMTGSSVYGGTTPAIDLLWYHMGPLPSNSTLIDATTGLSKFWLAIDDAGDGTDVRIEDQNGLGFAMQDTVVFSASTCTDTPGFLRVDIAVRADANPSSVFIETETLVGHVATPGTSTTQQTTVTVGTVNASSATNASVAADGYALWSAEVPFAALSRQITIAANMEDGTRVETEPFLINSLSGCT